MTRGVQEDLRAFAAALLERRGALVDWPCAAEEGMAVLPEELASLVDAGGETLRLISVPGSRGLCVHLATDFLEVARRLLEPEPRVGCFRVPEMYLKRGPLEEAVRRAFTWLNAKVTVGEPRPEAVEYHTWWFHAAVVSEDRWETRFAVSLNAASGVEVPIPDPLELWELQPRPPTGPPAASTYNRAVALARTRALELAAAFLARMDARLQRDRKRLREYYLALVKEADHKRARAGARADPEKLEAKKRAVQIELRRKLSELDERYAMLATLTPIVLVRCEVHALAVDLAVLRKRSSKVHTVYWNPLLKCFEPLGCSRCGSAGYSLAFSDEHVAPLCPACHKKG